MDFGSIIAQTYIFNHLLQENMHTEIQMELKNIFIGFVLLDKWQVVL